MADFFTLDIFFSFITLSLLEIVLGIDNLIFIALVVQNLNRRMQRDARLVGLTLALIMRVVMLLGLAWVMSLNEPWLTVLSFELSAKDLLMLAGGLFLIAKSTVEIHNDLNQRESEVDIKVHDAFYAIILQIVAIDLVFSFDSVITAIGMTTNIPVIVAAMVVAMIAMVFASGHIADFLKEHPTFKVLALSFILMIGTLLLAEGLHFHVPRGYVYFAFGFSIFVESINTAARAKQSRSVPKKKR